jgi:D-sedoheptulose 7-phosphate isomerase
MSLISEYLKEQRKVSKVFSSKEFEDALNAIFVAKCSDSNVWIAGNGGSAANSEHMANDLLKCAGVRAISATNTSLITAYANDIEYSAVFSRQIKVLARTGDVVLVMSVSGNSQNILNLVGTALAHKMPVIALVGKDGGQLKQMKPTCCIHFESNNYGVVEDAFLTFGHLVAQSIASES